MSPRASGIDDVKSLPGLKERELAALGPCAVCGKPQMDNAGPTFYRVTIARGMFDVGALQRRVGLEMMLGGGRDARAATIAQAMGPDEPLARLFDGPHDVFVHEHCALELNHLLDLIPKDAGRERHAYDVCPVCGRDPEKGCARDDCPENPT